MGYQARKNTYSEKPGYVYFIQAVTGGPIKIGWAGDPHIRMRNMQCGNPLELRIVALMNAAPTVERFIHERFADYRVRGEWFAPDAPGLQEMIQKALEDAA